MTDASRLLDSVIADEEYKPSPYKDSLGLWTFGIGRCLETNPLTGAEWKKFLDSGWLNISIGKQGASWLCMCQLAATETVLGRYSWFKGLNDARQNAFIEMAFQLGMGRFAKFVDMLAAANKGDWQTVHDEALDSAWAKETPARAQMIAKMLLTGEFP